MFRNSISLVFVLILTTAIYSCGGDDTTSDNQPNNQTTKKGVFLDSAVEGINYQTASQSGATTSTGEFSYLEGESITFSIGGINLPSTTAAPILTPMDLVETGDVNNSSVTNISRLLQTLDIDADPTNGITISATAHTAASAMTVSFESSIFDSDVDALVKNSGSQSTALVDGPTAVSHLQGTTGSLPSTVDVTGTWKGTITFERSTGGPTSGNLTYVLNQSQNTVTGTETLGELSTIAASSYLNGSRLTITSAPPQVSSDDCHLFSRTVTYSISGSAMSVISATGTLCDGNGTGGHLPLEVVTGGSGTLSKQ